MDFRDEIEAFEKRKTIVLGLSMDGVESHRRFKEKNEIPFLLLSDPDGKVCKRYGVIKEKTMYGKAYRGIERSTFIVSPDGKIEHAFRGVKVEGHVRRLLELLKA